MAVRKDSATHQEGLSAISSAAGYQSPLPCLAARLSIQAINPLPRTKPSLFLQQHIAAAVVLVLIGFGVGIWLERDNLLQGLADLWIISDPITRADAVVVLGGGLKYRPPIAAELYKKGRVSKVLVSQMREPNERILVKLGVPAAAIEMFGTDNRSTADEARAIKHWAEHNPGSILIIPAEIFAARRVRWIFRRELHATGVRVEVPSFEEDIKRAGWWKTSAGRMTFRDEVLKYIYYRLKY